MIRFLEVSSASVRQVSRVCPRQWRCWQRIGVCVCGLPPHGCAGLPDVRLRTAIVTLGRVSFLYSYSHRRAPGNLLSDQCWWSPGSDMAVHQEISVKTKTIKPVSETRKVRKFVLMFYVRFVYSALFYQIIYSGAMYFITF